MNARHIDDGSLVALLDDALADDERRRVAAHVGSCVPCRRRYEVVRTRSVGVGRWFAADDEIAYEPRASGGPPSAIDSVASGVRLSRGEPQGSRRRSRRALGMAAAVTLLATLALSPVGAAVSAWVTRPASGEDAAVERVEPGATVYGFGVDGAALEIVIEGAPDVRVVVDVADTARGSVTITGGDGSEEVVLRAGRIDLFLGEDAGAAYRVTVPDGVRLSVRRSGREVAERWEPGEGRVLRRWVVEGR